MSAQKDNGWEEYKRLVMSSLLRLERMQEKHEHSLVAIRQDIAALKVKAGIWGFAAGSLPSLITLLYIYVEKLL